MLLAFGRPKTPQWGTYTSFTRSEVTIECLDSKAPIVLGQDNSLSWRIRQYSQVGRKRNCALNRADWINDLEKVIESKEKVDNQVSGRRETQRALLGIKEQDPREVFPRH